MPVRLLCFFALALSLTFPLASCGYIPRTVAGLPPGTSWDALPLRKWLSEDRAEPLALSFCAPPTCHPAQAVSVIRLKGRDAEVTEALLKDPERLARALRTPTDRSKPVKTDIAVEHLKDAPYPGFTITMAPKDGGKAPAYGAALGRRSGEDLDVVLVIGESQDSVQETARRVAARELGS